MRTPGISDSRLTASYCSTIGVALTRGHLSSTPLYGNAFKLVSNVCSLSFRAVAILAHQVARVAGNYGARFRGQRFDGGLS